jgi:hypothetical protein
MVDGHAPAAQVHGVPVMRLGPWRGVFSVGSQDMEIQLERYRDANVGPALDLRESGWRRDGQERRPLGLEGYHFGVELEHAAVVQEADHQLLAGTDRDEGSLMHGVDDHEMTVVTVLQAGKIESGKIAGENFHLEAHVDLEELLCVHRQGL